MNVHPERDLSAYLDGELDAGARAVVEAHLTGCPSCRGRLADLRAVTRAIAALPEPAPRRSLVPRIAPSRPLWLAPLRTLSAIASGAFVFAFLVSTVLSLSPDPNARGSLLLPVARDAQGAPVFARTAAPALAPAPQGFGAAPGAPAASGLPQRGATEATGGLAADQGKSTTPTGSPAAELRVAEGTPAAVTGPPAFVWLFLAILFAAFAIALTRRMRVIG